MSTHADGADPDLVFRRSTEDDYAAVALVVDWWWDGRVVQGLLPRLWFRHFGATSWIVEASTDPATNDHPSLAGFLVGFISPGHPDLAVLQAVGVEPNLRRRGIGRALVERFITDGRAARATAIETTVWPGNRRALGFLASLGFEPQKNPDVHRIYGVPAIENYDFGTEDRARLVRQL